MIWRAPQRQNMYEIPRSVNLCLLHFGNHRSLIHFPDQTSREGDFEQKAQLRSGNSGRVEDNRDWINGSSKCATKDSSRKRKCSSLDNNEVISDAKLTQDEQHSTNDFRKKIKIEHSAESPNGAKDTPDACLSFQKPTVQRHIKRKARNKGKSEFQVGGFKGRASKTQNPWGSESYSEMISKAIMSCPSQEATLHTIYEWIVNNVSYFADKADYPSTHGWKNAIRHTLSIRKRFTRIIDISSPHSSLWTFTHKAISNRVILR